MASRSLEVRKATTEEATGPRGALILVHLKPKFRVVEKTAVKNRDQAALQDC